MRRLAILAAVTLLSACTIWPVDQDPYGMGLRRNANATIMALQAYHKDNGAFPMDLATLTPKYLPSLPDVPGLHYEYADGSLSYRYTALLAATAPGSGAPPSATTPTGNAKSI